LDDPALKGLSMWLKAHAAYWQDSLKTASVEVCKIDHYDWFISAESL
jgi:hypothetical protein